MAPLGPRDPLGGGAHGAQTPQAGLPAIRAVREGAQALRPSWPIPDPVAADAVPRQAVAGVRERGEASAGQRPGAPTNGHHHPTGHAMGETDVETFDEAKYCTGPIGELT